MPNTEDPIVLYLIVRDSLNMSPGKMAAQCGHGVQKVLMHFFTAQVLKAKIHTDLSQTEEDQMQRTSEWLSNASRKVVLKANEEEWATIREDYNRDCLIVKDAGLTELEPGSETLICLHPMRKSKRSNTLKVLRAL